MTDRIKAIECAKTIMTKWSTPKMMAEYEEETEGRNLYCVLCDLILDREEPRRMAVQCQIECIGIEATARLFADYSRDLQTDLLDGFLDRLTYDDLETADMK